MTRYHVLCLVLDAQDSLCILRGLGGDIINIISQLDCIFVGEEYHEEKKK